MYLGDFVGTETVNHLFTTVQATGAPTTLAGTPKLRVYKNGSTTESSDLTPTVDFDSRTGLNLVAIDLTGDSGFYATGQDYNIVITAGTVNSVSVVGYVVGAFSILHRSPLRPATAGRTLVVDANGLADANVVKLGPTGSGTAQTARDVGASVLLSTGTGTGQLDFTSGVVKANATQFSGQTITAAGGVTMPGTVASATNITAATGIDITKILGTAISTPATAGILDVNVKNMNNVAGTAITTVKAVQGLTTADTVVTVSGNVNGSVGSVTGAVGSVTGNVGGNVVGSVASVTGNVAGSVASVTGNVAGSVASVTGNVGGSVASVTAAVAITSNVKKNQALTKFQFAMTDSTNHALATGKTVTCTRSIDNGAFAAGTLANVAENASAIGTYSVDFGAGDLNGNVIVLRATATGCDDTLEQLVTQP